MDTGITLLCNTIFNNECQRCLYVYVHSLSVSFQSFSCSNSAHFILLVAHFPRYRTSVSMYVLLENKYCF